MLNWIKDTMRFDWAYIPFGDDGCSRETKIKIKKVKR